MKPLFSVITPVYNPPQYAFEKCIETVFAQEFKDWEWCLVDDCSTAPWVKTRLNELQALDQRVKVYFRSENGGIVAASNDAISLASGDFIVLLDNDDELHLEALSEVAKSIEANPNVDYLYSNEDKITEDGEHFDEFVKPDWSPERFLAQNYCSHLSVIRTSLVNQVGRFKTGFDGAQDYDLFLRITERTKNIVHIPKVLYHWRTVPGSTASANNAKLYAYTAAAKAVDEHLKRRRIKADVSFDQTRSLVSVKRHVINHPKISIIIPTCGTRKSVFGVDTCLVVNAVESIERKSSYTNFEIIVVVDKGTPQQVITDLETVCPNRLKIIDYDKPFNFSDKCNVGVVNSDAPLILMLNDDTEVISPDWLETMVGHIAEEDVAMVGPLLLYEDGRIQSAGHSNTHSLHNFCAGYSSNDFGHFRMLKLAREVSGLTGACALIKRDAYFEVGGMSEIFPLAFNDCDIAFKFLELGYRLIWTPNARLFHFESATRPTTVKPSEVKLIMGRWGRKINNDDFCKIH
jgi:glycosyltransferase involved in cell wall biosynthesis